MKSLFAPLRRTALSFAILTLLTVGCKKDPVTPKPIADFTYTTISSTSIEKVIQFTNTSKYADRVEWATPTGIASASNYLTLSFTQNGRVNVSITAKSDAGQDTKTQSIDIAGLATTGDFLFYTNVPDKGDISVYINNVLQGRINQYYTSGTPKCGEQGNVTVTLPPGNYPFTAKSQGLFPYNWSGTITVVRGECNSTRLTK